MNVFQNWSTARGDSLLSGITPAQYEKTVRDAAIPKHLIAAPPVDVTLKNWDGDLAQRRINVRADGITIECFGSPSDKKKLFIFLSAAGRKDATTKFHRVSWHPWFEGVCLNFEDPTYKALAGKVSTGWFFGTKDKHALPVVADIIKKVRDHYGIANEDICIVGSSAGGFAALWLANALVGATAIAGNPQFYALLWPSAKRYLTAGIDLAAPDYADRISLDHLELNGRSRYLVIVNAKSKTDYQTQLPPFRDRMRLGPLKYGLNKRGNLYLYCRSVGNKGSITPHNSLEDAKELRTFVDIMNSDLPLATMSSMLNMVHEMQHSRYALADTLFFTRLWAGFLSKQNLPIVLPPGPIETNTARLPLKGFRGRVYYELTWAPKGKIAHITLKAEPRQKRFVTTFEAMAKAKLGAYSRQDGLHVLHIGKFPKKLVRKAFAKAVKETSSFLVTKPDAAPPTLKKRQLDAPAAILQKILQFLTSTRR